MTLAHPPAEGCRQETPRASITPALFREEHGKRASRALKGEQCFD